MKCGEAPTVPRGTGQSIRTQPRHFHPSNSVLGDRTTRAPGAPHEHGYVVPDRRFRRFEGRGPCIYA